MSASVVQSPSTTGMANNSSATTGVSNSISAITAGNTLLVAMLVDTTTVTVTGISGLSAVWTQLTGITDTSGNCGQLQFWVGTGGSGSGTVTATFSAASLSSIALFEIASYGGVEITACNSLSTGSVTASTTASYGFTPIVSGDLLFSLTRGKANLSAPGWAGHCTDTALAGVQWMTDAGVTAETSSWTQASSQVYMIFVIGIVAGGTITAGSGTVAVAQTSTAIGSGGTQSTTLAATLPSVTAGNTMICFTNTSGALTNYVSGGGAAWTLVAAPSMGSPISMWAGTGYVTSGSTQTITAHYSATTYPSIQVIEISGLGTGNVILTADTIQATNSTTATGPSITPTTTNSIALTWIACGAATTGAASSGWTGIGANANYAVGGYIANPSIAAHTLSWTIGSSSTAQALGVVIAAGVSTVVYAPTASLADPFTSSGTLSTLWGNSTTGGSAPVISGGMATITYGTVEGDYYELLSTNYYNLTGSYVNAQVTGTGNTGYQTNLLLNTVSSTTNQIRMSIYGTSLTYQYTQGGSTTVGGDITYNATSMAWWQIINTTGGTVLLQTAPDGETWTTRWTLSLTMELTAFIVGFRAGSYNGTPTGSANVQYLNTGPNSAYRNNALSLSCAGFWMLNESTGTTAADSTANDNEGTYTGTYTLNQTSLIPNDSNTSLSTTGATSSTNGVIGVVAPMSNTTVWSLAAWVQTPATDAAMSEFILFNGNDTAGYGFGFGAPSDAGGSELFVLFGNVSWGALTYTLAFSTIYHIVVTFSSGSLSYYVNGILVANATGVGSPNAPAAAFSIATETGSANNRYFTGEVQAASMHTVALTSGQVLALYEAGGGNTGSVALWFGSNQAVNRASSY